MSNKRSPLHYVIDIGNTRIHCGIVNVSERHCLHRYDFAATELLTGYSCALDILSKRSGISLNNPVIVAGGTESVYALLEKQLRSVNISTVRFKYISSMPFTIKYDSLPGADRIADILFASIIFPGRNAITIGAGTAITINVLYDNQFCGGVILPGLTTQIKSLTQNAPVLPLVTIDGPSPLPGHSTETCIRSGVLYGTAGAVERIIKEYKTIFSTDFPIIATGGDWDHLNMLLPSLQVTHYPDMTLTGIALFQNYR